MCVFLQTRTIKVWINKWYIHLAIVGENNLTLTYKLFSCWNVLIFVYCSNLCSKLPQYLMSHEQKLTRCTKLLLVKWHTIFVISENPLQIPFITFTTVSFHDMAIIYPPNTCFITSIERKLTTSIEML